MKLDRCPNCQTQMEEAVDIGMCPVCRTIAWVDRGKIEFRVPEKLPPREGADTDCLACGCPTQPEGDRRRCMSCGALCWVDDGEEGYQTIEQQTTEPPVPIPWVEGEHAAAREAVADRSSGTLRIVCPHCGHVNEKPDWDVLFVLLCAECKDPIRVVDRPQ